MARDIEQKELEVLTKAYEDLVSERDRLRDARAEFTRRLGPLPASAAIVVGLVGSTAERVDVLWIVEAAVLLAILVLIGTIYSGLPPYRLIRGELQPKYDPGPDDKNFGFRVSGTQQLKTWLNKKIALEQEICGRLRKKQPFCLTRHPKNLQDALDVERSASTLVQILFAEIILVLVAGIAMHDVPFGVQIGVGGGIALLTLAGLLSAFEYSGSATSSAPRDRNAA